MEKVWIAIDEQSERSQTIINDINDVSGTWLLPVILGSEPICIAAVGDERFTTVDNTFHFCLTQVVKIRIIENSSSISSDIIFQEGSCKMLNEVSSYLEAILKLVNDNPRKSWTHSDVQPWKSMLTCSCYTWCMGPLHMWNSYQSGWLCLVQ